MKIRDRITLPFVLLFIAAAAAIYFASIKVIAQQLDRELDARMSRASALVAQSGLALNPLVLHNLKQVAGADVITYHRDGRVLATTLDEAGNAEFIQLILAAVQPAGTPASSGGAVASRHISIAGTPHRAFYRPLATRPDASIAFVVSTSQLQSMKQETARRVGFVLGVVILAVVVLSLPIARTITRPLERLVSHTRRLASGDRSTPAPESGGDEIGGLARAFDEMAAQLEETETRLVRSEKLALAGQLAARVAHEVRNPMSSIRLNAQLLAKRLEAEGVDSRAARSILAQGERVEWVVQGLLDLANPQALEPRLHSLNEVLESALEAMSAHLAHFHIALDRRLTPEPLSVSLDAPRFRQALINLLGNAAEAMPTGGTLTIVTAPRDAGRAALVEIADEGPGVSPQLHERIFDPFFTTKGDGVGLGLVNAKSIIEGHGGRITLEPAEPRGLRVCITLPLAPAENESAAASAKPLEALAQEAR